MAEDRRAIVGSVASWVTCVDDAEGVSVAAEATTRRDRARAQVWWMVDQARRAAQNGRADDARWWSHGAIDALWNLN